MQRIPKGTKDILPSESYKWQQIESEARKIAALFGAKEIRTPIFEHTELFTHGMGDTSDVVTKEMYTFLDKGGRSLTLKPEGTAGVVRSFIENNLDAQGLPVKLFYFSQNFRYERPQAGRYRQHVQFGVEFFGSKDYLCDAEVIELAYMLLTKLQINDLVLNINSIGCAKCRGDFTHALQEYITPHIANMCPNCQARLQKNPLRILDCKEEGCKQILKNAPSTLDYVCSDCKTAFTSLTDLLQKKNIPYQINPKIVRGLDYYSGVVFEFTTQKLGAQGAICAGGRYDNLVQGLGGKDIPACGFGMGLERLILLLDTCDIQLNEPQPPQLFIAFVSPQQKELAYLLAANLRAQGVYALCDTMDRSLKAQLKYADKQNAKFCLIIGEQEQATSCASLKNMSTGQTTNVSLNCLKEALEELK